MTVSYRKVGKRWHIRFLKGSGKARKETTISLPGRMREESVRKKADWYDVEWSMGRFDPFERAGQGNGPSLNDALFEYCEENLLNGNWAEKSTYKTNKNVFRRMFDQIGEVQLGDRTDENFFQKHFMRSTGNSRTRKGNAGRLNSFLKWAFEKEYLPERYKVDISMHEKIELRNIEKVKYLTWEQVRDICQAHVWSMRQTQRIWNTQSKYPPDFYTDMWWFYFYSLLRSEELAKLEAGDLLNDGRLRVQGKGRRTDIIYLPPPALTIAEKYAHGKKKDEPMFTSSTTQSRRFLGDAVRLAMGKEFAEGDGRTGFHQLRHGGVVHYLSLGKPIQFVSKLARHKSINITDEIYGDIINEAIRDIFEDVEHKPATIQRRSVTDQRFAGMN